MPLRYTKDLLCKMTSTDIPTELRRWAVTELFAVSKRVANAASMPRRPSLEKICCGKNKHIWLYLIEHVRSRASVRKIKNDLYVYRSNESEANLVSSLPDDRKKCEHQISALKSRQSFVENQVIDLEMKLNSAYMEMEKQKAKLADDGKFLGLLIFTTQSFNYKEMQFRSLLKEIHFNLEKIQQAEDFVFTSTIEPSVCVSINNDSENILKSIKCTFSKLSQINSSSFHQIKRDIWDKIEQILMAHLALDLIVYLKERSKMSMEMVKGLNCGRLNVNELNDNGLFESSIFLQSKINSRTSLELQHQRSYHIGKFMQNMKLQNHIKSLNERIVVASFALRHQLESADVNDDVKSLHWTLLATESKCSSSMLAIQDLQQEILNMESATKHIQERNDNELFKTQQIHYYQSLIVLKRNAMCEFLKQNGKLISRLSERQLSMRESMAKHFASEKVLVESAMQILTVNLEAEASTVNKMRKEFPKPDLNSYRFHDRKLCSTLKDVFKVLPFQSQYSIIQNCLNRINHINIFDAILEDKKETLLMMQNKQQQWNLQKSTEFYDTMSRKQKSVLNQAGSMIDAGNQQIKLAESYLAEIEQRIIEWWEQPAQYILPIQSDNRTLKEWVDLLTMLLKS